MKLIQKTEYGYDIGRLEVWKIRPYPRTNDRPLFYYQKASCGCRIVNLGKFGATFNSKECSVAKAEYRQSRDQTSERL